MIRNFIGATESIPQVTMQQPTQSYSPWRFCVAPMMQYTDRHFRYLVRIMSRCALLYTEMVVCDALLYGDQERFLAHSAFESPVALQLGGSSPEDLAKAAILGEQAGYSEINLNVGCPSDRVQSGRFGACLMAEPELVADCVSAMRSVVNVPVTVKSRTGIDRRDSYDELATFVDIVARAGCTTFIVHARKAWLDGLSPRENREIPPLQYARVYALKRDFPELTVVINGGIETLQSASDHLRQVDGVMLGRVSYQTPFVLADLDRALFANSSIATLTRFEIFSQYLEYARAEIDNGTYVRHLAKPLHYLFQGEPGARQWRRHLSEHCTSPAATIESLASALTHVRRAKTQHREEFQA